MSIVAAFTTTNMSYGIENGATDNNVAVTNGQAEFKISTLAL